MAESESRRRARSSLSSEELDRLRKETDPKHKERSMSDEKEDRLDRRHRRRRESFDSEDEHKKGRKRRIRDREDRRRHRIDSEEGDDDETDDRVIPRQRASRSPRRERHHITRDLERSRRDRSGSRHCSDHHYRTSASPPAKRRRRSRNHSKSPLPRSRAPLPSQDESFRGNGNTDRTVDKPIEKQKPNFKPTGLLAKEANTVTGTTTVLKYHEPPEARKPKQDWRMYIFKGSEALDTVPLYTRSCWLFGRDQAVTDWPLEHPSISKQHAVIQFRHITSTNVYGDRENTVKPYLIDLESANGTMLNGKKIDASRYVELVDTDMMQFGDSTREYLIQLPKL